MALTVKMLLWRAAYAGALWACALAHRVAMTAYRRLAAIEALDRGGRRGDER